MSLTFGGNPLLDGVSLSVRPGDRIALVGRNGSGKSTLMKVMAGLVEPDSGERQTGTGVSVAYMDQAPPTAGFATLADFAMHDLPPGEGYRAEAAAEGLDIDLSRPVATASGGEIRRAALARVLAGDPSLLLLDEPTNHLDIAAIEWLEDRLKSGRAGLVLISHDRAFLKALTNTTLWLDRGELRRRDGGYDGFEDWRDTVWAEEDLARHKLNRKIKAEARWAVEGISARRKRNQGRVRALAALRAERSAQIARAGRAALDLSAGPQSGKKVVEAEGLVVKAGDRTLVNGLNLTVARGDRVALVGPNGIGKTTLIEVLTGRRDADGGKIKLGTGLEIANFDQNRAALDPDASLWDSLALDPSMAVSGKSDQIMVRGQPRHVVGYLKDFLFDEARARAPVRSLSGGEKARLLLARLMAREANLLVLDEPTNDLDIETLDLLQELIADFDGTVLLVSHDRDFIDRTATQTLAFEGQGRVTAYAGGWSDMLAQRGDVPAAAVKTAATKRKDTAPKSTRKAAPASGGLAFTERHRLKELPALIARTEAEIAKLGELLADPDLYATAPTKFAKATAAIAERQSLLAAMEEEWLDLAERDEAAQNGETAK